MKFIANTNLKDTSFHWLGRIDEDWALSQLFYLGVVIRTGKVDVNIRDDDGEFPFFTCGREVLRAKQHSFDCEAILVAGNGEVGFTHYYNGKFEAYQRTYVLSNFRKVLPGFLMHYLNCFLMKAVADKAIGSVIQFITLGDLRHMPVPVPAITEQTKITAFLDHETAKIDRLIAKQKRLIELLKEKQQAIISHAVTNGLDPDALTKEAGTQWMDSIPRNWRLIRARFLFKKEERPALADQEVITAYRDGQVCLRSKRRTEGYTFAVLEHGYQSIEKGDLVIHGMDAFAGAIGVSEDYGKATPEYVVLTASSTKVNNEYMAHVLRLMASRNYIFVICPSVRERAPRFRFPKLQDVFLPVPPIEEQNNIVTHINKTNDIIDRLSEKARHQIELLAEHRSALISAAVTGKIDVRSWQKSSTEPQETATAVNA